MHEEVTEEAKQGHLLLYHELGRRDRRPITCKGKFAVSATFMLSEKSSFSERINMSALWRSFMNVGAYQHH
jgi:hypothetical protein